MIVSPARRIVRAISLGVFWRLAPSTRAIMRSRNVSPGFEVILTVTSSESTRVPPVTADRSPPLSRMTGADSPVMADSSTVARPSTTSPSPGITSPATTTHRSPIRKSVDAFSTSEPSGWRTIAMVSALVRRSVAACALPRPSAIASAKLANSTVNHSHRDTMPANTFPLAVEEPKSRKKRIVVTTEPTSTTNITGLRIIVTGFSLTKLSLMACFVIAGSRSLRAAGGRRRLDRPGSGRFEGFSQGGGHASTPRG